MAGGYSRLITIKKAQADRVSVVESKEVDTMPSCNAPIYGALYAAIVSICTCLFGSIFFVHKWFSCLNYLIGRDLFKPIALAVVWALLLGIGVTAFLMDSFWMIVFMWLGHVAVAVYLLSQLRKCGSFSSVINKRLKVYFILLALSWGLEIWLILFYSGIEVVIVVFVFVSVQICLIQAMFNLVVYEAFENRSLLDARIEKAWRRFRVVMLWLIVVLSVLLFLGDVLGAVGRILSAKDITFHGFNLDGKFHLWLFFEEYYPHSEWQLYLWCLAALIVLQPLDFIKKRLGIASLSDVKEFALRGLKCLKGYLGTLFPNISNK